MGDLEGELSSSNLQVFVRRKVSGVQNGGKTVVAVAVTLALVMIDAFVLRCGVGGVNAETWRGPKIPVRLATEEPPCRTRPSVSEENQ